MTDVTPDTEDKPFYIRHKKAIIIIVSGFCIISFFVFDRLAILPMFILAGLYVTDFGVATVVGEVEPSAEELAARRKRNVALGLLLAAFMVFVFFTMLSRAGAL